MLVASSSPISCHAQPSAAAVMMTLQWRGEATTKTTPTCRSSPPPRWRRHRSTMAPAMGLHQRRRHATRLPPLDAVVISITLGDLAFFVLSLACSGLPLHCRLVPVENRLLRVRRLGRNKVGALQLQRQEGIKVSQRRRPPKRSTSQQKQTRCIKKITTHNFFCPRVGEHRKQPRRRPRVGRPPERLCHTALDLERRRECDAVTVPIQGTRSAIISQSQSGRLRSGTTPRA
jgi:hypothetical protein